MTKYLIGLLLILSSSSPAYPQPKTDSEKSGLLGRVKSVEWGMIEYPLRDGRSVEGRKIPRQLTAFNEGGNTAEVTAFKEDGSVSGKTTYNYDAQGRNVGTEGHSVLETGGEQKTYKQKLVYTLDERGNRVEEVGYQSDGTLSHRHVFKFDTKGNKVEVIYYSWNGSRVGKIIYTYDDRGNELTQTSYNSDDSVGSKSVSTYDQFGNLSEWVQYHGDALRYRVLYKHDEKGRLKEQETFEYNAPPNTRSSHAPVPGKVVYTYDDAKRTKEEATFDEGGTLVVRVVTRLDGRGNEVARAQYEGDGSPRHSQLSWYDKGKLLRTLSGEYSVKFEYDSRGNWTRKTYFIRPKGSDTPEAYGAEYRVITYY